MLSLKEFKEKVGATKNKYIQEWLDQDLIPGVRKAPALEDTLFPDSARRPYRDRGKISADSGSDKIRAHIVRACCAREHISNKMCHCSPKEFEGYVNDLIKTEIIRIRVEDGITYYDATDKCAEIKKAKLNAVIKFVSDAVVKMGVEAEKAALNKAFG